MSRVRSRIHQSALPTEHALRNTHRESLKEKTFLLVFLCVVKSRRKSEASILLIFFLFFFCLSVLVFEDFECKNPKKNMDSVQALVTQIQGLSSSAGDISRLHSNLKHAEETIFSESARFFPALDQLDPSIHSLGYLYIL